MSCFEAGKLEIIQYIPLQFLLLAMDGDLKGNWRHFKSFSLDTSSSSEDGSRRRQWTATCCTSCNSFRTAGEPPRAGCLAFELGGRIWTVSVSTSSPMSLPMASSCLRNSSCCRKSASYDRMGSWEGILGIFPCAAPNPDNLPKNLIVSPAMTMLISLEIVRCTWPLFSGRCPYLLYCKVVKLFLNCFSVCKALEGQPSQPVEDFLLQSNLVC